MPHNRPLTPLPVPAVEPVDAPPPSGPVDIGTAANRWAPLLPVLKLVGFLLWGAMTSAVTLVIMVRGAATSREVDQAERAAEKYAEGLVDRHATTGPHAEIAMRLKQLETSLVAVENEQNWEGIAIEVIADKLGAKLPPRPVIRKASP